MDIELCLLLLFLLAFAIFIVGMALGCFLWVVLTIYEFVTGRWRNWHYWA